MPNVYPNLTDLPPKINYDALFKQIVAAHSALGELRGALINIPNPDLLTSPLLFKEATLSSRIEGTQATLDDVLEYEAEEKTSQSREVEIDIIEILNYRKAIHFALEELKKKPLGENIIKKVHYILMDSVRGANRDRGNFRRIQVWVGKPGSPIEQATYIPPNPTEIPSLFSKWENYLHSDLERDSLIKVGVAHYQFEAIHPFMDGNGRIGRLLIPLLLYQNELLTHPTLYISEFFESRRDYYYDSLHKIDTSGVWEDWLDFFLAAVETQSLKTQIKILKMLDLYNNLKSEVSKMRASYAVNLLDLIFTNPFVTFNSIKKVLNINNQTIYNLLKKFVDSNILIEFSKKKRNKLYVFQRLREVIDEP